jgi:uncharacterized protein YjdB
MTLPFVWQYTKKGEKDTMKKSLLAFMSVALLVSVSFMGCSSKKSSDTPTVSVTGVSFTQNSVNVLVNATADLTQNLSITPASATNKSVTWSSDKTAVATVLNGVVTGVSAGSAIITVTTADGGFTATCTVNVSTVSVAVTSVTVAPTTATITVGGTPQQLVPTVIPSTATNKSVTWSSDTTGVATVDNAGLVSAVAAGTAKITVTTADGGKTAFCTVTVNAATTIKHVTAVTVSPATLGLTVGGTTGSLTAAITPSDATDLSVSWSSDNTSIATVSGGTVTAVAAGTANIYATSTDGSIVSNACVVTVAAASSGNNDLSALTMVYASTNETFSASTTSYTASVNAVTTFVTVTPTVADATATVKVNGTTVASGTASGNISLSSGVNNIVIVVTAQNLSTKTYTIAVTRTVTDVTPASWTGGVYTLFSTPAATGTVTNNTQTSVSFTAQAGKVNTSVRNYFLVGTQVTGDFVLTARLASVTATSGNYSTTHTTTTGNGYRFGLLYSENLTNTTVASYAAVGRFNAVEFYDSAAAAAASPTFVGSRAVKLDVGGTTTQSRSDILSPAVAVGWYLRLIRNGTTMRNAVSSDGVNWTITNTSTFVDALGTNPIASTWNVGFFAAPKDDLTFTFDNISIVQ